MEVVTEFLKDVHVRCHLLGPRMLFGIDRVAAWIVGHVMAVLYIKRPPVFPVDLLVPSRIGVLLASVRIQVPSMLIAVLIWRELSLLSVEVVRHDVVHVSDSGLLRAFSQMDVLLVNLGVRFDEVDQSMSNALLVFALVRVQSSLIVILFENRILQLFFIPHLQVFCVEERVLELLLLFLPVADELLFVLTQSFLLLLL